MASGGEQKAAWALSQALDDWLATGGSVEMTLPGETQPLLSTAQRLAQIPALLPPPQHTLVRRALSGGRTLTKNQPHYLGAFRWRTAFVAGFAAIICMFVVFMLSPGRDALAEWMAHFSLGRLTVVVTPEQQPALTIVAKEQHLADIDAARAVMPFTLMVVGNIPAGYTEHSIVAVTYQGMPEWVPQPFYLETNYGPAGQEQKDYYLTIRQFAISFGPNREVNRLGFRPEEVVRTEQVTVGDEPAVVVELGPGIALPLRELIWQHEGIAIELTSRVLTTDELVSIAESMR
jgi:hypothetical protein